LDYTGWNQQIRSEKKKEGSKKGKKRESGRRLLQSRLIARKRRLIARKRAQRALHNAAMAAAVTTTVKNIAVRKTVLNSTQTIWNVRQKAEVSLLWPPEDRFQQISVGGTMACGITSLAKLRCWGEKAPNYFDFDVNLFSFKSVSVSDWYGCAVTTVNTVMCFASVDGMWRLSDGQSKFPRKVKWAVDPSCGTSHPTVTGPASCTSCPTTGCNTHFTVVDPQTNTGTCTKTECPFCKPKSCCTPHHKHYVLNTASLEGICVRYNDDCTPVCVPQGINDPTKRRVCTKGCNMLTKAMRDATAKKEEDMYDMVVCQADKRVLCDPKMGNGGNCQTTSKIKPIAVCKFSSKVWNLGGTCIANHLYEHDMPQCPEDAPLSAISLIGKTCRQPAKKSAAEAFKEDALCERLGMSF